MSENVRWAYKKKKICWPKASIVRSCNCGIHAPGPKTTEPNQNRAQKLLVSGYIYIDVYMYTYWIRIYMYISIIENTRIYIYIIVKLIHIYTYTRIFWTCTYIYIQICWHKNVVIYMYRACVWEIERESGRESERVGERELWQPFFTTTSPLALCS